MKKKDIIYDKSNEKENEYISLNNLKRAIYIRQLMCLQN